jgi:hypothetical protein
MPPALVAVAGLAGEHCWEGLSSQFEQGFGGCIGAAAARAGVAVSRGARAVCVHTQQHMLQQVVSAQSMISICSLVCKMFMLGIDSLTKSICSLCVTVMAS